MIHQRISPWDKEIRFNCITEMTHLKDMIGIHNLHTKDVKQIFYKAARPWLFGLTKAKSVSNRISRGLWETDSHL